MIYDLDLKYCKFEKGQEVTEQEINDEITRLQNLQFSKKSEDLSLKKILNSIYGVFGFSSFILYDKYVASSISTQSAYVIKYTKFWFNKYFKERFPNIPHIHEQLGITYVTPITEDIVIYGDTDSVFVNYGKIISHTDYKGTIEDFVLKLNKIDLYPALEHMLSHFISLHGGFQKRISGMPCLKLTFEQIIGKFLISSKKRYVKELIWENGTTFGRYENVKAIGLEMNQTSVPKFIREKLKEIIIDCIIKTDIIDYNIIVDKIRNIKEEFTHIDIINILSTQRVNNLGKYILECSDNNIKYVAGSPIHIRAIAQYNNEISLAPDEIKQKYSIIKSGDKIQWYYTTSPIIDVFAFPIGVIPPQFLQKYPVSYDIQFMSNYLSYINRILVAIGLKEIPSSLITFNSLW